MSQSKKGIRLRITSRKVHYTADEKVAILLKEKLPYKLSRKYLNIIVCVPKYSRIVIYTYLGGIYVTCGINLMRGLITRKRLHLKFSRTIFNSDFVDFQS